MNYLVNRNNDFKFKPFSKFVIQIFFLFQLEHLNHEAHIFEIFKISTT